MSPEEIAGITCGIIGGVVLAGFVSWLIWRNYCQVSIDISDATRARYTKAPTPINLIYQEIYTDKTEAEKRELKIRKMTWYQKKKMMRENSTEEEDGDIIEDFDA